MADTSKFSRGATSDWLAKKFGGLMRDTQTVVSVGLTTVSVLGFDPERVSVIFVNLGASEVFLSPGQGASTTRGIRLAANGGLVAFNVDEDGTIPCSDWTAISTGAGNNLYVCLVARETVL